jgi:uncharacterized protein YjbI with pentapeptide repeats
MEARLYGARSQEARLQEARLQEARLQEARLQEDITRTFDKHEALGAYVIR